MYFDLLQLWLRGNIFGRPEKVAIINMNADKFLTGLLLRRFEHMLEEALSSDYEPQSLHLNTSLKEQEQVWEEEEEDTGLVCEAEEESGLVYKELVPVIGYVSPRWEEYVLCSVLRFLIFLVDLVDFET